MSMIVKAFIGADIHDGKILHKGQCLVVDHTRQVSLSKPEDLPEGCPKVDLGGGLITPGFVDLQVNGGGGVMFNDDQSLNALRIIAEAHASTGTSAILPTLITDTPKRTRAAIDAVEQAIAKKVDGITGIHLEGPHLSIARKGALDPNLIRAMDNDDLALLLDAADRIANVMVTVAPESTSNAQIAEMKAAGITVSLGHTNADYTTCHGAFDAGACGVTHLFNAMSQLGNREPGLVGATLEREDIYAGLIADGIHVHTSSIRLALAAKPKSERIFLGTDAMATAGSSIESFSLNGRDVSRKNRRLTLADGTLAGADLEMTRAVSVMVDAVGEEISTAIKRATSTPTELLRDRQDLGRLGPRIDCIFHLSQFTMNPKRLSLVA